MASHAPPSRTRADHKSPHRAPARIAEEPRPRSLGAAAQLAAVHRTLRGGPIQRQPGDGKDRLTPVPQDVLRHVLGPYLAPAERHNLRGTSTALAAVTPRPQTLALMERYGAIREAVWRAQEFEGRTPYQEIMVLRSHPGRRRGDAHIDQRIVQELLACDQAIREMERFREAATSIRQGAAGIIAEDEGMSDPAFQERHGVPKSLVRERAASTDLLVDIEDVIRTNRWLLGLLSEPVRNR